MADKKYKCFDISVSDHVANLVLSRPDELNTMSRDFWVELGNVCEEINRNSEIRVVVMSSTGKHFCAGMDLSAFSNGVDNIPDDKKPDNSRIGEAVYRVAKELQGYISSLEKIRVPVIAAIQGGCVGGAVDLVTACDIRMASNDAFFCIQEINIGMTADVGTFPRLPYLIPMGLVKELAYTGRRLLADEAKDSGLVNKVFKNQEEMMSYVMDIATQIAEKTPLAVWGSKDMINFTRGRTVREGLDRIALWQSGMYHPKVDMKEAFDAQMENRDAEFEDLYPLKKDFGL